MDNGIDGQKQYQEQGDYKDDEQFGIANPCAFQSHSSKAEW